MDIYKKSEPLVLEAVQEPDGVFRVPPIVERVEWKVHYHAFKIDDLDLNNTDLDALRLRIGRQMMKDIEGLAKDLFRYSASS